MLAWVTAVIAVSVVLVVAGVVVGVLYAVGVLGGSSAVTPTLSASVTLPLVGGGGNVTPTPVVVSVTPVTITNTPVPTIVRTGSLTIPLPASGAFPISSAFTLGVPLPNQATGAVATSQAIEKLVGFGCAVPTFSSLTTTGATATIATCNGTANPVIGTSVGASTTLINGSQSQQNPIPIVPMTKSSVVYPALAFRANSSQYLMYSASNSTFTTWLAHNTISPGVSSTTVSGIAAWADTAGLPVTISLGNDTARYYKKFDATGAQSAAYSLAAASSALSSPMQSIYLNVNNAYAFSACTASNGLMYCSSANAAPASGSDWATWYFAGFVSPAVIGRLGTRPCIAGRDSSDNLLFILSNTDYPISSSDFASGVTVVAAGQGQVPQSAYNMQCIPMTVSSVSVPCILWIDSSSFLRYVVSTNNTGSAWPTSGTRIDSTTTVATFQACTLSSGNIGVVYITSANVCKYALLTSTTQTITTVGTTARSRSVGIQVISGIPFIAVADDLGVVRGVSAGANNETFSDSVTFTYAVEGS